MKKLILSAILVFLSIFLFAQKNTERMIIPESHLRFTANEDYTEVTITGFKGDKQFKGKVLEIPSKIQGIPVTAIGDSAFWGWIDTAGIEGLWIPDCVKKIGYSAFFNSSFSSIRLPEGLETIKPDTFKWCKVKSINLPSSVKTLMGRAFYDSYLESFTIPKDCVIGNSFDKDKGEYLESNGHVFESSNLKTLIFPKGRVYFYDNFSDNKGTLFSNCNYLEKIVIPEELEIVLVYYGNYEKEYTLADFITGEKINASFELQKQLKSVKIRNIADIESEERLVEYNKALNSNDYETAMQIAMEYYNKYENYKNMEWCDRYLTACEKKYLDEYNMSINTDWDKAEQIVKDCIYTINYEIEKLGWIRKNDYFKGRLEELKEKWQDLLAEIKNKKMEKRIELAFVNGDLHTNLACNIKGEWLSSIAFEEKKDVVRIGSFKIKKSIFEEKGLKAKDVVKEIILMDSSGNESKISWKDLLAIRAPATLLITVERGSGKKAQLLTISIPVEWNEYELKN